MNAMIGISAEKRIEMIETLSLAQKTLNANARQINLLLREYFEGQMSDIRSEVEKKFHSQRCEGLILVGLSKYFRFKKEILESPSDQFWLADMLEDQKRDLNSLLEGACSEAVNKMDPDVLQMISENNFGATEEL